jgi:hypothetical protein
MIQTANLGDRRLIDLQQDLAGLTLNELRAFLGALQDMGLPLPPVLALAQIAITGGPLITKTYARAEWLDLIRAGRAFGQSFSRGAGVGLFPHVQYQNPAASGRTMLVYYVNASPSVNAEIVLALGTAAVAGGVAIPSQCNLKAGGGAPVALVASEAPAVFPVVSGQEIVDKVVGGASSFGGTDTFQGWICEVPAGQEISIAARTANEIMTGYIWWAEVDATY